MIRCQESYCDKRRYARCEHPARWIVRTPYSELLVCGYHRRAWLQSVCTRIAGSTSECDFDPEHLWHDEGGPTCREADG